MSLEKTRERLNKKNEELKKAQKALRDYEKKALTHIAQIAKDAGLLDVDITENQLLEEFKLIAARFQSQSEKQAS